MSEYLGIRVAMLDAIQRYQKTPDIAEKTAKEKAAIIQTLLKDACKENGLLAGDRKEIIGEAWSRLIGARDAEKIVSFIEHPEIAKMARDADPIQPQSKELTTARAIGYVAMNGRALSTMVTNFENIAKTAGVMYTNDTDSVSENIARHATQIIQERGMAAKTPAESASAAQAIRDVFNNNNSKVDERLLGNAPASAPANGHGLNAASAPAAAASRAR